MDNEFPTTMENGLMKVKGLAYEDIVSILYNNGYETEVRTCPQRGTSAVDAVHIIRYWKEEENRKE